MKIWANAKINWALACTGTLPGGFHALDMLMESVSLHDELELEDDSELSLLVDGQRAGEENLVYRAAMRLREETGCTRGARMTLKKAIPARAGLGGGSADCAAALAGLLRLWGLEMPREKLLEVGLSLGSDVPFCLTGGLCRAKGRGEILTPILPEGQADMLIVMGKEGLSTGTVFAEMDEDSAPFDGDMEAAQTAAAGRDTALLASSARNALYAPAMRLDPEVGKIVGDLYRCGAAFAAMSGSGSACFGVWRDGIDEAYRFLSGKYAFCGKCHTETAGYRIVS